MTPEPSVEPVPVESDGIRGAWVVGVAIATLGVMACGVGVAWEIARSAGSSERASRWGEVPEDIQAIEMSLLPPAGSARPGGKVAETNSAARQPSRFSEQRRSDASALARLSQYGWSDPARRTLHIPLARAMELYLQREGQRAAPAAKGGQSPPAAAKHGNPPPKDPR
jgi:hypothetical protein